LTAVGVADPRLSAAAMTIAEPRELLSVEERRRRLSVLEEGIRGCQRCALSAKRTQTVFARGTGSSGLCFVGEGPGEDEDLQGAPFVGLAGQLLDRMILAMGLSREEVYVCNIVKCRPPGNRKPELGEVLSCRSYLDEQLELVAPEVIVALGATAAEGLLGSLAGGITRLRGTWKLYKGRIAVMPTFHPAYLLRVPNAKHAVWEDMQAVLRQLGRPVPERGRKPRT
jgi:DNA polymerase